MLDVAKRPQLFFCRFERLSYRSANVWPCMAFFEVVRLAADDQMSMRRVHIHMHLVHIAFAVLFAARLDGHATGNEPAIKFLKLGHALTNVRREAL